MKTLSFLALASAAGLSLGAAASSAENLTQAGWAKLLVDRMALAKGLPAGAADQAIALLSGRVPAVEKTGGEAKTTQADGAQKTWRYDFTTPATATWVVSAKGTAPAFLSVDKSPSRLTPALPGGLASDVGRYPLLAGPHSITVHVAQNVSAPDIALSSGCSVVAPPGGWSASTPLTYGVLGRTLVQALHQQGRLPAAEALAISPVKDPSFTLNVEREGTYTLLLSGHAFDKVHYRLDGCEDVHPALAQAADGWREGATVTLVPGAHTVTFYAMEAKGDGRVRLVRRSSSDTDHLSVLQGLGVKLPTLTADAFPRQLADRTTGGVRHAHGDALGSLANRLVTREEAERILSTPVITRMLSNSVVITSGRKDVGSKLEDMPEDFQTFDVPISPTVPGGPDAQ